MCTASAFAQTADKAKMECLYRLSFLKDTTSTATTDDMMVLRFNKDKSLFFSERSYMLDSLLLSDQAPAVQADILAGGAGKYGKRVAMYNVLKDFKGKKIDYADNVGGEYYRYTEDLPDFGWAISGERKKIGDYTCTKATCSFRGRTYEAWFTDEIPVSDGPWKFHGLPGLILEVYDTAKHYSFVFAGLRGSGADIALLPLKYTDTTREKYLKAYRNYIKDPLAFLSATSGLKVELNSSSSLARRRKPKAGANYDAMERY